RANDERDRANEAKQEAKDNLHKARKNLKLAKDNLKLAKKAVNDTFDIAKNNPLLQQPGMHEVRKFLLEKALPFYRRFREVKADEARPWVERAEQYFRVGYITSEIGNKTEARKAYAQAEKLLRSLVADNPADTEYRTNLAKTLNNMGNLLQAEGKR